ncbi:MAG TPA: glycosyltransferase family 4 protein [Gemmatimonadaceae bacterium]
MAMTESVHTVRWIRQLQGQEWDLHLYPSREAGEAHVELEGVTVHQGIVGSRKGMHPKLKVKGIRTLSRLNERLARGVIRKVAPDYHRDGLVRTIRALKPDVVHSMEIQAAGYLTLDAREKLAGRFPPWIVTNWGSDIYLFGRLPEHRDRVRAVLGACDFYSCECERDVQLAREFGFAGSVLPVVPNSGGYDLERAVALRSPGKTSTRRLVLLKGYQNWAGRALVALRAIELAADALRGYRIAIYGASTRDVRIAAELLRQSTSLDIELVPPLPYQDMLRLFGQARVAVGLSISDAISTLVLESMVMGAFPIQSCTSCASEWVTDGKTGMLVPPNDPEPVAAAIRRAVTNDPLVNSAAEENLRVARARLDAGRIREIAIQMYETASALLIRA